MKYANLFVIISFLVLLASCEKYEDEFGFTSSLGTASVVQVDAQPGKYALDIQCPFNIETGDVDILEVGFRLNSESDVVGSLDGNNQIVATLSNLEYGKSYRVTPYIRTSVGVIYGPNFSDFIYNSQSFAPVVDSSAIELVAKGVYRVIVNYSTDKSYPLTEAIASADGETVNVLSADEESVTVEVNVNDLSGTIYAVINLTLANAISSMEYAIPFSLTLLDTDITYSDDGVQDDCIRVCGIDWAKGNLQYEKGIWKIADTQDDSFLSYGINSDYVEYFCFGDLNPVYRNSIKMMYFPDNVGYRLYSIKGNPAYDIVSACFSEDWSIPSSDELSLLANKASYQYGYVERNGQRTYGYLFYTQVGKIVRGHKYNQAVRIDESKLDELGLFLPTGRYQIGSSELSSIFTYMSSDMYVTGNGSNFTAGKFYTLQSDRNTYKIEVGYLDDGYSGGAVRYQLPVRPVKNL